MKASAAGPFPPSPLCQHNFSHISAREQRKSSLPSTAALTFASYHNRHQLPALQLEGNEYVSTQEMEKINGGGRK